MATLQYPCRYDSPYFAEGVMKRKGLILSQFPIHPHIRNRINNLHCAMNHKVAIVSEGVCHFNNPGLRGTCCALPSFPLF